MTATVAGAGDLWTVDGAGNVWAGPGNDDGRRPPWWLTEELELGELRQKDFPCLVAGIESRGMRITDHRGRVLYDSRPGRPDAGTLPPAELSST